VVGHGDNFSDPARKSAGWSGVSFGVHYTMKARANYKR
jgi:hypothetical protein